MKNPFNKVKEISRKPIGPFHVVPGDEIRLTYSRRVELEDGTLTYDHELAIKPQVLVSAPFTKPMTVTEGVIFECEYEGCNAMGGLFVEGR